MLLNSYPTCRGRCQARAEPVLKISVGRGLDDLERTLAQLPKLEIEADLPALQLLVRFRLRLGLLASNVE